MTTPLDLGPIKEREAKATWGRPLLVNGLVSGSRVRIDDINEERSGLAFLADPFAIVRNRDIADWIVKCATDIPLLVAEVERLRETMNQIISTTSEPVVKKFAEYALK